MTVAELIAALSAMDPGLRVVTRGYEAGYEDINNLTFIELALNVGDEWYYGPHDHPSSYRAKGKIYGLCQAVVINGERE